jgi:hypothetical protein
MSIFTTKNNTESKNKATSPALEAPEPPIAPAEKIRKVKETTTPKAPKFAPAKRSASGKAAPKSAKKSRALLLNDHKSIPQTMDELNEEEEILFKWRT